jgi:putative transposase
MKTSRYTDAQIISILRQAEGGVPVAELCRAHRMSNASFYTWRAKYGGMDVGPWERHWSEWPWRGLISQMKAIEDENRRLKRMYADLSMQADLLKDALGNK